MPSGQLFSGNNGRKCVSNIPEPVARSEARLRLSGSASNKRILHPDAPVAAYDVGQELALVVAALAGPRRGQRHGNEQVALLCDIPRKVKPRHLFCHWLRQRSPASVLELVHDLAGRPARNPRNRSHCSDKRRKKVAPAARARRERVAAARAPRSGHSSKPADAERAQEPMLSGTQRAITADTRARQKQVESTAERRAATVAQPTSYAMRPEPACYVSAPHITSRFGSTPSHLRKDRAACSTSMGRPSDAGRPASRAARTHAVSPLR